MSGLERISFARVVAVVLVGAGALSTISANAADDLMAQFEMTQSQLSKSIQSDLKTSLELSVMIPEIPKELRKESGPMMAAMDEGVRLENS